jgi:hypothetical protein
MQAQSSPPQRTQAPWSAIVGGDTGVFVPQFTMASSGSSNQCGGDEERVASPANGSGANGFSGLGCVLGLIWMGLNGFVPLSGWVLLGWIC